MYTSYIGKKFLQLYISEYNKPDNYSVKQFFDEEFFPLFFDDKLHLMHVHGSTFFQSVGKNDVPSGIKESVFRLNRLHSDVNNKRFSGSTYVGFAAGKIDQPTSGQVSSVYYDISSEDAYASWIGEALSIGVNGGLILLLEPEVWWKLFNGWKFYRRYLSQTPNIKGRQIETWNGHWFYHTSDEDFDKADPLLGFELPFFQNEEEKGVLSISTIAWSKIVFALAKRYPTSILTCYSYFLGKMNSTFGFINLYLPEVNQLYELRDAVFIRNEDVPLTDEQIEKLETFFNFRNACKLGTIGLKALEPAQLRQYMPKGSIEYAQGKEFRFSDMNSYTIYQLLKLWIIAMLNKTELLQLASDVATLLIDFENDPNNRGKKDLSTLAEETRSASNMRLFIEKLTSVLDKKQVYAETFKRVVEQVLLMPSDNYPLFATLVRFEYQYQKSKK